MLCGVARTSCNINCETKWLTSIVGRLQSATNSICAFWHAFHQSAHQLPCAGEICCFCPLNLFESVV